DEFRRVHAPRAALWRELAPHRGGELQIACARAAGCGCAGRAAEGTSGEHEGQPLAADEFVRLPIKKYAPLPCPERLSASSCNVLTASTVQRVAGPCKNSGTTSPHRRRPMAHGSLRQS